MPPPSPATRSTLLRLTARIVAAHISRNQTSVSGLADLIQQIFAVLGDLADPQPAITGKLIPAVAPNHSVHPDYIICLEDGKKLKMLKRHLKSAYNLSPEEYRLKWGLPADYPMVAASYLRHRASLAKSSGLGKVRGALHSK